MITPTRRGFLTGLAAMIAAPAIVRPQTLMPINPRLVPVVPAPNGGNYCLSAGMAQISRDGVNWQNIGKISSFELRTEVEVADQFLRFGGRSKPCELVTNQILTMEIRDPAVQALVEHVGHFDLRFRSGDFEFQLPETSIRSFNMALVAARSVELDLALNGGTVSRVV